VSNGGGEFNTGFLGTIRQIDEILDFVSCDRTDLSDTPTTERSVAGD